MRLNFLSIKLNIFGKIIISFFLIFFIWWIMIFLRNLIDTKENFIFGFFLSLFSFTGGIIGIIQSKKWGLLSSVVGKAIFFFALGLITWGLGTLIFVYYNLILQISVPYPSIADVAYIISWPLWAIGIINLSKATGMKFQLKKLGGKLMLLIIPLVIILLSYYLLFIIARGGNIDFSGGLVKMFFDLAYPIGDVIILSLGLLVYGLSFNYLGGRFKIPVILIILSFVFNYISDFSFSYTTTMETFFVASWVDMLFTTTIFLLGLGLSLFDPKLIVEEKK